MCSSDLMLQSCRTPELVTEITLQPVRRHKVDAAIFFSDIVVPLAAAGIDLDIVPGTGPVVASPVRSRADVAGKLEARRVRSREIAAAWLKAGSCPNPVGTEGLEVRLRLDEGKGDIVRNSAPAAKVQRPSGPCAFASEPISTVVSSQACGLSQLKAAACSAMRMRLTGTPSSFNRKYFAIAKSSQSAP